MKKHNRKKVVRFITQLFMALLNFGGSLATKFVSLNSQPFIARPTSYRLKSDKLRQIPYVLSHHVRFIYSIVNIQLPLLGFKYCVTNFIVLIKKLWWVLIVILVLTMKEVVPES